MGPLASTAGQVRDTAPDEPAVSWSVSVGGAGVDGVPIGCIQSEIRPPPIVRAFRGTTRNWYFRWLSSPTIFASDSVTGSWSPAQRTT